MDTPITENLPAWASTAKLAREHLILLAAARVINSKTVPERAEELLQPEINWERLLREADRHSLKPLLHRFLAAAPPAAVPHEVLTGLRQFVQDNLLHNLKLTGELWTLLELFAQHKISAVPFKGPTLALLAFADLSARQFGDLDLLIAEEDLARITTLLCARGYEPWTPATAVKDIEFRRLTNVLEFQHPEKQLLVEMHWRLSAGLLPLDLSEAWRTGRLTETFPAGKRLRTFAPEPLLVYLCVHATKHCWLKLNWAADLAWLIQQRPEFDWRYTLTLAQAQHCRRTLHLGLLLAGELLGAALPPWLQAEIAADRTARRLAQQVVEWWTRPAAEAPGPENGRLERSRFFCEIQDDWRSRGRYFGRLLFAPNLGDWKFVRLPSRLRYLYVLLRPLRFLLSLSPLPRTQ